MAWYLVSTTCLQSVFVTHKPFISLHHYQPLSLLEKKEGASPWLALIIISTSLHPLLSKLLTGTKWKRKMGYLSEHQRIHTSRPSHFLLSLQFSHWASWSVCPPPFIFTVFICMSCIKYSRRARQLVQMKAVVSCYLKEAHENQRDSVSCSWGSLTRCTLGFWYSQCYQRMTNILDSHTKRSG